MLKVNYIQTVEQEKENIIEFYCPKCSSLFHLNKTVIGNNPIMKCNICNTKFTVDMYNDRKNNNLMRNFGTGATRNSDEGKFDYEGFISPIVLERYAQYMNKHRMQADGKLRDSDNWQKTFGEKHLDVCMKSAFRHFIDWWKQHRGFKGQDTLEDSICALIFNANAYLFKILKDKGE